MTVKDFTYVKINSINSSYFINNKIDWYVESNGNKSLTLVEDSKGTLKSMKNYG